MRGNYHDHRELSSESERCNLGMIGFCYSFCYNDIFLDPGAECQFIEGEIKVENLFHTPGVEIQYERTEARLVKVC